MIKKEISLTKRINTAKILTGRLVGNKYLKLRTLYQDLRILICPEAGTLDRREEIYEKAMELFIAEGYDRTPLSRIAKALGLAKAGLYHYFSSKEDLLFFIHERNLKRDLIPIMESAEKIKDPEKRISYLIKEYTRASMTRDASARVLIHEAGKLKPEHRKIINQSWRRFFDLFRNSLSELEALGKSKKINKTFAAFALIGMCRWTFYWFDTGRMESANELSDTYEEIFFKGILKK